MRKKIFIIHGKGVKNGLGTEGGGDLDTVGSNVFYNVWINNLIREKENRDAVYGKDYEFDFVNYQAGLSHLKVHKGCDIYLPDFPIDALSPRLKFQFVNSLNTVKIMTSLASVYDELKNNIYSLADKVDDDVKYIYNSLINKIKTYFSERSETELAALSYLLDIFNNVILAYSKNGSRSLIKPFKSFFLGINLQLIKGDILSTIDIDFFQNLKDKYNSADDNVKNLFADFHKILLSNLFKIKNSDNGIIVFIEFLNILIAFSNIISNYKKDIDKEDFKSINKIFQSSVESAVKSLDRFAAEYKNIQGVKRISDDISKLNTILKKVNKLNLKKNKNGIMVMLFEEESLSPVKDVEISFKIVKGKTSFVKNRRKIGDKEIEVKTNNNGTASIDLFIPKDDKYYITATYDDLNYLVFTNITDKKELKELEDSGDNDLYTDEEESIIEKGNEPARALKVALKLIAKDFAVLKKNDVRIVRIDDHHPWTKEILELLLKFKEKGLITDSVTMSGLERGKEQPKEEQKCGTDLIYESLVENRDYDNSGYKYLRYLAHVQDLHIKEDKMAILLSKLIGSGFSKIEMVQGLAEAKSKSDLKKLIRRKGWVDIVDNYERSLKQVLPRVEKNIVRARFLRKPTNNNFKTNLGIFSLLKPFFFFIKNKEKKENIFKRLYALNSKNRVDVYLALSPFTDKKAGEAKINVASAINYLKTKYKMDYFFYCYGSMLMTTRRVNEDKSDLNLSMLVAYVGTKADGGHAEAATGKPASNPDFPKEQFPRVNDYNFFEYAFYIASKVSEFSGLELFDVSEARIRYYDINTENVLNRFEEHLVKLNFVDKNENEISFLTVKNVVPKSEVEPRLNFSAAVNYLLYRKKFRADYFVYLHGSNKAIFRKLNDDNVEFNIKEFVKFFGDKKDTGFAKIGISQPAANKKFPIDRLKFINTYNYMEYLTFLSYRISEFTNWKLKSIEPILPKNNSPVFKNKLLQIRNSVILYEFQYPGKSYKMVFAFSPRTESFKNKDAFSYSIALAYLRKEFNPDILFFTNGFMFAMHKINLQLNFDMRKIISRSKKIITTNFINERINIFLDNKDIFLNRINELNFFALAESIVDRFNTVYKKIKQVDLKEELVVTIPASNEIILEKIFNNLKRRKIKINDKYIKSAVLVYIPYLEKNIRLTFNELLTYLISRVNGFDYVFMVKDRNTLIIKNVSDNQNLVDFKKISNAAGSNKDIINKKSAVIHPSLRTGFDNELFGKVTNNNLLDYIQYILNKVKELELI